MDKNEEKVLTEKEIEKIKEAYKDMEDTLDIMRATGEI